MTNRNGIEKSICDRDKICYEVNSRMTQKLYMYKNTWILMLSLIILSCASIVGIVCSWLFLSWYDALLASVILSFVGVVFWVLYIRKHAFRRVYVSDDGVAAGPIKLGWDEIKITAYPLDGRGPYCAYYLLIYDDYVRDKEMLKRAVNDGVCLSMSDKSLNAVFTHYKSKLSVVDKYGDESVPQAPPKLNAIITEFNNKIAGENTAL